VSQQTTVVEEPAVMERHAVHADRHERVPLHHHKEHEEPHATVGQKLKGAMKQMVGTITGDETKKEEGRLLKQGIDPTTANEPNLETF
jgi:hypothetical protein